MKYEKFINIGVGLQRSARSVDEARDRYAYSCDCCASQGKYLRCEHCGIDEAHRAKMNELTKGEKQ